jgi:hypothetical protein
MACHPAMLEACVQELQSRPAQAKAETLSEK